MKVGYLTMAVMGITVALCAILTAFMIITAGTPPDWWPDRFRSVFAVVGVVFTLLVVVFWGFMKFARRASR
jgi:hypothetical protein